MDPPILTGPTNCSLVPITNNSWQVSNYNLSSGYEKNAQCLLRITPKERHRFIIWFTEYFVELFDFVVVQSILQPDTITIKYEEVVVFPESSAMIEFYSDGNIQYGGFTLNIVEYNCTCSNKILVIPCEGTITKYYSDDIDNVHATCETTCFFKVAVDEACSSSLPYVTAIPPPQYGWDNQDGSFDVFYVTEEGQYSIMLVF